MLGFAMFVGGGIGAGIMMPLITLYILATFSLSMAITATVTSLRDLIKAPVEFISGVISDRWGRKPVLVASFLLYAVGFFISIESGGMFFVYVGAAVAGTGAGCMIPAGMAFIGDVVPMEYMARAMAVYWGLYSAGTAVGSLASGFLAHSLGYKNAILVGCAFTTAGAFVYWFGLSENVKYHSTSKHSEFRAKDLKFLVKSWNILVVTYLTFFLAVERMDMPSTFLPLFATKGLGINIKNLGWSLLPVSFVAILAYPGGWIADKIGRKRGLSFALLVIVAGMLGLTFTTNMTMLIISSSIVFAGTGLGLPTLAALVNDIVPANIRGSAMGFTRSGWALAMVVYPPIMLAVAAKWGFPYLWILTAFSLLVGVLAILTIKETTGQEAYQAADSSVVGVKPADLQE